jgi:prepilin signal peptidase PulO-like enzyme (type II secretory pathway)
VILAIGVYLWLAACAVCDLKWREVPPALTLPPLFGAVLWNALTGKFALALFVLLLFILADIPFRGRGFANGLQAAIFCLGLTTSPEPFLAGTVMLTMIVIWSIWKFEKMGGADAQVLMALALLLGPAVLLPISVVGGIQGLIHLLAHKKTMPFMVSILAGTCVLLLAQPPSF